MSKFSEGKANTSTACCGPCISRTLWDRVTERWREMLLVSCVPELQNLFRCWHLSVCLSVCLCKTNCLFLLVLVSELDNNRTCVMCVACVCVCVCMCVCLSVVPCRIVSCVCMCVRAHVSQTAIVFCTSPSQICHTWLPEHLFLSNVIQFCIDLE